MIEEVCEEDYIMSLCISDPFEIALVANNEFLNKFNLDDSI